MVCSVAWEAGVEIIDQSLIKFGHADGIPQINHAGNALVANATWHNAAEMLKLRFDIDGNAVKADPAANAQTDGGNLIFAGVAFIRARHPYANTPGGDMRFDVKVIEGLQTLDDFNIKAHITPGRIGVWVPRPDKGNAREDKIAAIGLRIRRWISFHGISINVEPELEHFSGIVPCGISDQSITSMVDLGYPVSMAELDKALVNNFDACFPSD